MNKSTPRRFLPLLMVGAFAMPVFAGWGSALATSPSNQRDFAGSFTRSGEGPARLVQLSGAEVAALALAPQGVAATSQQAFAHPAFQRTWERTDTPVASGQVQRSWYWGPFANTTGLQEDYAEGAGGKRLVQYFDKSRMEINNPAADPNSPFFVTNGLLTVELISGRMQTGNSTFVDRYPADIPLASDPDDANAPTYYSFRNVITVQANSRIGLPATGTIARNGTVGDDPTKASYPKVNIAYFDQTTKHNVPQIMWEFLNETGPVYNSATRQTTNARLSDPWFYTSGLPISEAYWARTKIANQMQDVLIQAYERRVITYVPNGVPGFKVQVGNIGQHYFDWRYKNAGRPANQPTPGPATTPTSGTAPTATRAVPTATSAPVADCSGIPAGQNMVVTPNCAPAGSDFEFEGSGFQPGEDVGIYITLPDQAVFGAPFQDTADSSGRIIGIGFTSDESDPTGIWAITMEGTTTHRRAVGYFKVTPPAGAAPTPTPNPNASSCSDVPASTNMQIAPSNCARAGTVFAMRGSGFRPGEKVGVYITLPDQAVYGAPFQVDADGSGVSEIVTVSTQRDFPLGIWALTMEGVSSHNRAIAYFKLTPP
ncbi:MAG TPA: hypothetical protein VM409_07130 [Chloroflexia bacterium]|nr:hypothetical protein [Chloroflexia bacterium]